jgi:hypothetical protein
MLKLYELGFRTKKVPTAQRRIRRQSLGGLPFLVRLLTLALLVGGLIGGGSRDAAVPKKTDRV